MTTSRLWRTLGLTGPLLTVTSPALQADLDDHSLSSLTIEAGTTMAGMSTAAATITAAGVHTLATTTDTAVNIDLTPHGAARLSALTGRTAAALTARFRGRFSGQKVTDTGNVTTTTLTAQDWPALVSQLDKGAEANQSEPSVWTLYESLLNSTGIPELYDKLVPWGSVWPWVRWAPDTPDPYLIGTSDVTGKFAADLGILIRQARDGVYTAWSHDHIRALADQWSAINPDPLQRSQVLKPVEWTRASTIPTRISWTQQLGIGDHNNTGSYMTGRTTLASKIDDVDMTHVWDIGSTSLAPSEDFLAVMNARASRASEYSLTVETVTVDVLALLERNSGVDRPVIGQLLTMNHGDPIALGYDWPDEVAGVYFAARIIHRITPRSWRIELDLMPEAHVSGWKAAPDLTGRTWETAYPRPTPWDQPATTWETTP